MPNQTEPNIGGRNNTLFIHVSSTHQALHMCWEYLNSLLIHAAQFHNTTVGCTTQFVISPNRREKKTVPISSFFDSTFWLQIRSFARNDEIHFIRIRSFESWITYLRTRAKANITVSLPLRIFFYVCGIFINHTKIEHQSMTWALYTTYIQLSEINLKPGKLFSMFCTFARLHVGVLSAK